MPHSTLENLYSLLGFIVWGDLAEVTIYRDKQGKTIWFPKTYPDKPPSQAQLDQRQVFRDAATEWSYRDASQKKDWHDAARKSSLCMHGYDLFVFWQTTGDEETIRTIERQTGITLLPP